MPFYQDSISSLFQQFDSGIPGISNSEAEKRIREFGPNALQEKKEKTSLDSLFGPV